MYAISMDNPYQGEGYKNRRYRKASGCLHFIIKIIF